MDSTEPSLSQRLQLDLVAVLLLTALAAGFLLYVQSDLRGLRLIAGLALITFLPGYALTALLFPATQTTSQGAPSPGLSGPRRYALSVVLSLILVPAVGLAIEPAGFEYTWERTTSGVAVLTSILAVAAAIRRSRLAPERRLSVPVTSWYSNIRGLMSVNGKAGFALNVVLLVSVLLAAGGATYAITASSSDSPTELYLLMENDQGELVADDFPQELPAGETTEVVVGIEEQGERSGGANYTVVVQTQRIEAGDSNLTVVSRQRVDQFQADPGADGQFRQPVQFSLDNAENRYRVAFMMYPGETPASPTIENAYREVHLVIDAQSRVTRIERPDTSS